MKVAGVIGWPVAHSRSPAMHEAALGALGIDARYVKLPVRPRDLAAAIAGVRALGLVGVNVTVPHKAGALPLLDEVEPQARRIGAVNTIWRDGERLLGANTDAPGLLQSLRDAEVPMRGRARILGAGGAARAAVVGLADAGFRVDVAARRPAAAQALVDLAGGNARALGLDAPMEDVDLVVQATSATMSDAAEAFAAGLRIETLPRSASVLDLVYTPRRTAVLEVAERRGLRTIDGLGMLVHQGALAFRRFFGEDPDVDVMRAALEA